MEMECAGDQYDVIVVGGGVMGSSTAYQVAKRGQKTLLVEQLDFLHHQGSSHGESRTIRATYSKEYYSQMVHDSYALWEQTQSEAGYKVYFKSHHLDMGPAQSNSLLASIAICQKFSWPCHVLNSRQVSEKFSGRISIPEDWVGLSTELGGVIKPTKAVAMFQTLALQNGAVLKDHMEVTSIVKDEVKGGVWVVTAGGEKFWGKKCVVTVGSWMSKLVKTVRGIELPIQPLEISVYYWRIKEGHELDFSIGGDFPTFSSGDDPHVFGTPSLEYPGLIKVLVHGGPPCDPDRRPWGRTASSLGPLKKRIDETFSGLVESGEPAASQVCMYSMTPDGDFVIDFLGGEFGKDVVVGGGFSGHGFKMAPVVGKILADLVLTGETQAVDLNHFRIPRFEDHPSQG